MTGDGAVQAGSAGPSALDLATAMRLLPHWARRGDLRGEVVVGNASDLPADGAGEAVTGAGDVEELLTRFLGGDLDEAASALTAAIGRTVVDRFPRLSRVGTDDGIVLVGGSASGRALRLSLAPRPAEPGDGPDPADLGPGSGERLACVNRLLGEFVSVGENARIEAAVTFAEHGLDLAEAADPGTAVDEWWRENGADLVDDDEIYDEDEDDLDALSPAEFTTFLNVFEAGNLYRAAEGASLLGAISADEMESARPRFPDELLVAHLGRDLFATIFARLADGGPAPLVYGLDVNVDGHFNWGGGTGCLILFGGTEVAVVLIE
ncbi:hypothetical protein AB0I28_04600 [Phytomonospora sp. NPDC050363]|uniref:hypothetical protein n=1 Tax=Phytomonospora sp. NPDC050363 TaxID=3155642 RepID=UPI0033E3F2BF